MSSPPTSSCSRTEFVTSSVTGPNACIAGGAAGFRKRLRSYFRADEKGVRPGSQEQANPEKRLRTYLRNSWRCPCPVRLLRAFAPQQSGARVSSPGRPAETFLNGTTRKAFRPAWRFLSRLFLGILGIVGMPPSSRCDARRRFSSDVTPKRQPQVPGNERLRRWRRYRRCFARPF